MALLGKSVKIFDTKTSGIPVDSVDLMLFQENHHEIVFATRSYTNSSIYIYIEITCNLYQEENPPSVVT